MSKVRISTFLVLGVIFHGVYIWSIFDIYFKSPIVRGMKSVAPLSSPPAKRVVFFVGDGCRADKVFEQVRNEEDGTLSTRIPFLRNVALEKGSWGISHTRVPTESRPGHVALFAGFYEDVSAVTKGWQENPVEFDSIFNQSSHSWLFGSPDIVPMFAKNVPHAEEWHYSHEEEDFAKNASSLDIMVLDKVKELFAQSRNNESLYEALHEPKIILFLHFLGIDTNGHAYRPNSNEYLDNIKLVDRAIEEVTRVVDEFYGQDGNTAYIFTADHGMSNKGAHGDGDPSNTRTPLIAWGAGIAKPELKGLGSMESEDVSVRAQLNEAEEEKAKREWGDDLNELHRKDVMQADIAPLVSSLLGTYFPLNSVGKLPIGFLQDSVYRLECMVTNALQVFFQLEMKNTLKKSEKMLFFPYPAMQELSSMVNRLRDFRRAEAQTDTVHESKVRTEHTTQEILGLSQHVLTGSLEGLQYFQTYDHVFLLSLISVGYIGWCAVLLYLYFKPRTDDDMIDLTISWPLFACCFAPTCLLLSIEQAPVMYYLYLFFPCFFFSLLYKNLIHKGEVFLVMLSIGGWKGTGTLLITLSVVVGLEMIVMGYINRDIFFLLFILCSLWPWLELYQQHKIKSRMVANKDVTTDVTMEPFPSRVYKLSACWTVCCWLMAVFPLLPAEYGEDTRLVHCGMILLQVVNLAINTRRDSLQSTLIVVSSVLVESTQVFLTRKEKPPVFLPFLCWSTAFGSIYYFTRTRHVQTLSYDSPQCRIISDFLSVCASFLPAYILLSISYEVLFYSVFSITLLVWILLEIDLFRIKKAIDSNSSHVHTYSDTKTAFLFLLFVKIAFFGTGNIASMSSFEISSTYRFVTVFSPFLMGSLLIFKILLPFGIVASAFRILAFELQKTPFRLFLLVLCMCDALSLNFLFLIQSEGSWKEIGNSISYFGIVNAQIVFIPILFLVSKFLLKKNYTITDTPTRHEKRS